MIDDRSGESVTLSTGHTVTLPLELEARIAGVVMSASVSRVRDLLPAGFRPLRVTPRRGAVTILSVDYRQIGDDAMAPYDELNIQIPAVRTGARTIPVISGLYRSVSGFVWRMPVSTRPAMALGREIWGYPKCVADIAIDHGPSRTQTTVDIDGERLVTMAVDRPRQWPLRFSGYTLTESEGALVRAETGLRGAVGVRPYTPVDLDFGDHPDARTLAGIDLGARAVVGLAADCWFRIGPPVRDW
ncbi:MAG: acetoacetate decarboxylase family protein [Halococcoides sp.]